MNLSFQRIAALCVGLIAILLVCCCDSCSPGQQISSKVKTYVVVGFKGPTFYVDLRDIETGAVYTHLYASKHCNVYSSLQIGTAWEFLEVTYRKVGVDTTKVEGVTAFCNRIKHSQYKL